MKKYLTFLFLLLCAIPISVNAAEIFNIQDSFTLARAVKLGRGKAYSTQATTTSGGNGGTEITKNKECDINCNKCDSKTGSCSSCKSGRYLSGDICLLCQDDDIAKKASSVSQNATKCLTFGTTNSGECNCLKCKPGYLDATYPANHGMVLGGYKVAINTAYCVNCPANAKCNGTKSITCNNGYYHMEGHQQTSWAITHLCQACPEGCSSCTNETSCSACKSGYTLKNGKCEANCTTDEVWGPTNNGRCAQYGRNDEGKCVCTRCNNGYVDSSYPPGEGDPALPDAAYCVACPDKGTCDGTRNVTCASGYTHESAGQTQYAKGHWCKADCTTDEVWGDVNNGRCSVYGKNSEGKCACLQCNPGYVDASCPTGVCADIKTTYCIACPDKGTCDGTRNVTCASGYTHKSLAQTQYAMGHWCEAASGCQAGYFTSLRTGSCVKSQCYSNRYLGENECLNYEGCKKCFYNSSCPGWQCQDDAGTLK